MAILISAQTTTVPSRTAGPRVSLRFRFLRDGVVTPDVKSLRMFRDWDHLDQLSAVFQAEGGEFSDYEVIDLATLQGTEWLSLGRDDTPPRYVRAAYLTLSGGTVLFNITSGEEEGGGGGGGGTSASAYVLT